MLVTLGVGLAVAIGATMQRISGMGVGLIAAPVLSLLLGPVDGVLLVNLLAVINAATNTWGMRDDVDWRKFWPIALTLPFGVFPGAWVIAHVSPKVLLVLVGALLLLALSIVTLGKRYVPDVEGRRRRGARDHRLRARGALASARLRRDAAADLPRRRGALVQG